MISFVFKHHWIEGLAVQPCSDKSLHPADLTIYGSTGCELYPNTVSANTKPYNPCKDKAARPTQRRKMSRRLCKGNLPKIWTTAYWRQAATRTCTHSNTCIYVQQHSWVRTATFTRTYRHMEKSCGIRYRSSSLDNFHYQERDIFLINPFTFDIIEP